VLRGDEARRVVGVGRIVACIRSELVEVKVVGWSQDSVFSSLISMFVWSGSGTKGFLFWLEFL
jgi:hypothetical protein